MQKSLQRVIVVALLVLFAGVGKAQLFVQQGSKLYATGGLGPGIYGSSVSVSADGNVAVVGAPADNNSIGAIYIMRRTGTSWAQDVKLVGSFFPSRYAPYQGSAVAISADGNTVITGGYDDNLQGGVWIYHYNGGSWSEQKHIIGTANQRMGTSVSLNADGTTALIGNYYDNSAEVWRYSGVWNKEAAITCSDAIPSGTGATNALVGSSVSLSADGNTALIGGENDAYGIGAVWIFTRNGSTWTQQGSKITAAGIAIGSNFGNSVSLSGDASTALVGASGENSVYVFTNNNGTWAQQGSKLIPSDVAGLAHVGASVSISADGNTALFGGYLDNSNIGAAWIFTRSGNTWTQLGNKLVGTNYTSRANQGNGVSLSADGKTAIIGGPKDDNFYGSAWVFVPAVPTITAGTPTGTIYACLGMASVDPYIQEFGYSGSLLSGPLTITAPAGFEVSFDKSTGYQASISAAPTGGSVSGTVYVRAAASTSTGQIFANVTLSSPGATAQIVPVSLIVFGEPVVKQLPDQSYAAGSVVSQINFTGSGNYKWTNDNPSIGLPASGTGTSILPFTTINATAVEQDANITVTPLSPGGCEGTPMHFVIKVAAGGPVAPTVQMTLVTGKIVACMGTPSASPNIEQFTVSGSNLTADIILKTSTPNIEISTNPASGYVNTIDIAQINGAVAGNIIYVRASGSALAGALSATVTATSGTFNGTVPISGTVNLPGSLNAVANQTFAAGITTPINFSGTATAVTWTNDNPAIGLSTSGTGNIPAFTATNNGTTALVANITATPANASGCNGNPVTFTITVPPAGPGGTINASGNVAQLSTVYGTPSTSGLFAVSGDNLKAGLTVTAPAGFEVSIDNITFSKTVTVGSAGTVPSTAVYIRLAKTTATGTYSGTVVVSSTGAANGSVVLNINNSVARAPLTIIADDKSKITGNQNPLLTVTYKGFVNGDTSSVFTAQPVVSTIATINSPPGTYPITANGAASANYRITYVAGAMTVNAQPLSIVTSNAFTPNGDGVNDTWIIKNIEGFPNSVVRVYSRYGAAVFYSVSYAVPWDGKRNGADLPAGTYYYIIDLKNGDKPTAGWVAIIR